MPEQPASGDEAHGENASSTEVDLLEMQVVDFLTKIVFNSLPITFYLSYAWKTKILKQAHDSCKIYKS